MYGHTEDQMDFGPLSFSAADPSSCNSLQFE